MPRPNLHPTMATALSDGLIVPAMLAELTFKSGIQRVWSGVGNLVWDSKTWSGVGALASVGAITEASAVQAEGTTVTLSGIGLSQVDLPALGFTPPAPPFAPVPGESVAWAVASTYGPPGSITIPPSIWNDMLGVSGASGATPSSGFATISNGDVFADPTLGVEWSGYRLPLEVPEGATITRLYAVANGVALSGPFAQLSMSGLGVWSGAPRSVPSLAGLIFALAAASSLPGGAANASVDFVGVAVYYEGEPLTKTALLYEAMNDIRLGAPAKIWFGLMSEGAFLGAPYLVFSGSVDKPTVKPSPNGSTIELALENRMVNLQRASNRKYTAADQHLFFPDDLFFNWVEILQDISLKEGQA